MIAIYIVCRKQELYWVGSSIKRVMWKLLFMYLRESTLQLWLKKCNSPWLEVLKSIGAFRKVIGPRPCLYIPSVYFLRQYFWKPSACRLFGGLKVKPFSDIIYCLDVLRKASLHFMMSKKKKEDMSDRVLEFFNVTVFHTVISFSYGQLNGFIIWSNKVMNISMTTLRWIRIQIRPFESRRSWICKKIGPKISRKVLWIVNDFCTKISAAMSLFLERVEKLMTFVNL